MPTAIKCFFDERPRGGAYGFGREQFLNKLQSSDPVRFRKAVELIIRDQRLTTLGPVTTGILFRRLGVTSGGSWPTKTKSAAPTASTRRRRPEVQAACGLASPA